MMQRDWGQDPLPFSSYFMSIRRTSTEEWSEKLQNFGEAAGGVSGGTAASSEMGTKMQLYHHRPRHPMRRRRKLEKENAVTRVVSRGSRGTSLREAGSATYSLNLKRDMVCVVEADAASRCCGCSFLWISGRVKCRRYMMWWLLKRKRRWQESKLNLLQ